jgi:hypothetical protein
MWNSCVLKEAYILFKWSHIKHVIYASRYHDKISLWTLNIVKEDNYRTSTKTVGITMSPGMDIKWIFLNTTEFQMDTTKHRYNCYFVEFSIICLQLLVLAFPDLLCIIHIRTKCRWCHVHSVGLMNCTIWNRRDVSLRIFIFVVHLVWELYKC